MTFSLLSTLYLLKLPTGKAEPCNLPSRDYQQNPAHRPRFFQHIADVHLTKPSFAHRAMLQDESLANLNPSVQEERLWQTEAFPG